MREFVRARSVVSMMRSGWKRWIAACAAIAIGCFLTIACIMPAWNQIAPPPAGAHVKALSQATNSFGQDLAAHLPRTGNLVFSPYSISTVLALALSGARGAAEEDMLRVLRHRLKRREIDAANAATRGILARYRGGSWPWRTSSTRVEVANAIMLTSGSGITKDYLAAVEANYGTQAFRDASAAAVNSWVKQKTDGKIAQLVDQLPANTSTILLNPQLISFRVTRPFLFYVADNASGAILFQGRVVDPRSGP